MSKIIVDEDEYLRVCNEELRKYQNYEDGMEIIGVPRGSEGKDLSGYNWKGGERMAGIVSQVVSEVNKKYQLQVTK